MTIELGWHKSSYSAPNNSNCVEVCETPRASRSATPRTATWGT